MENDRNQAITKDELQGIIIDWGCGRLTSQELQLWMELNYFPLHFPWKNEPENLQKAMHVIINKFEQGNPNYLVPENYKVALEFLDATEQNYEEMERKFLEQCFKERL